MSTYCKLSIVLGIKCRALLISVKVRGPLKENNLSRKAESLMNCERLTIKYLKE